MPTIYLLPDPNLTEYQIRSLTGQVSALVEGALGDDLEPQDLSALQEQIHHDLAVHLEHFHQETQGEYRPACSLGCDYCCRQPVEALVSEVVAAVEWARANLPLAIWDQVQQRIVAYAQGAQADGPKRHYIAGRRCPFNDSETGKCLIYPVRPLPCARYNSYSVGRCRYALAHGNDDRNIESFDRQQQMYEAAEYGMEKALQDSGYDARGLEFIAACALYIENSELWHRWAEDRADAFSQADWDRWVVMPTMS